MLAYVVLPAVWRRHGALPPDGAFPRLTYTAEGIPADPINVALVGTREDIVAAMRAAGWIQAARFPFGGGLREAGGVPLDRPYPAGPMSTHFVARRRPQDIAFEQLVGRSPRRRHHVRFWRYGGRSGGRAVWLGAASFDRSLGISRFTGEVMHHIDPRIDAERDKLIEDLGHAGRIGGTSRVTGYLSARRGRNGGGDWYVTDGRLAVVVLRPLAPVTSFSSTRPRA